MADRHAPIPGVTEHAQIRAAERCPVPPTRAEWLQCVLDILDGRGALVRVDQPEGGPMRRELWLVYLGDCRVVVVWAPLAGLAVTVLSSEYADQAWRFVTAHRPQVVQ